MKKQIFMALAVLVLLGACKDPEAKASEALEAAQHSYAMAISAPDAATRLAGLNEVLAMLDKLAADYPTTEVGLRLAAGESFGQLVPAVLDKMIAVAGRDAGIEGCFRALSANCILMTAVQVGARANGEEFEAALADIPDQFLILARILDADVAALKGTAPDPAVLPPQERTRLLAGLLIRGRDDDFTAFLKAYPEAGSFENGFTAFNQRLAQNVELVETGKALGLPVIAAIDRLTKAHPIEGAHLWQVLGHVARLDEDIKNFPDADELRESLKDVEDKRISRKLRNGLVLLQITGQTKAIDALVTEYQEQIDAGPTDIRMDIMLLRGQFEAALEAYSKLPFDQRRVNSDLLVIGLIANGGFGSSMDTIMTLLGGSRGRPTGDGPAFPQRDKLPVKTFNRITLGMGLPLPDAMLFLNNIFPLDAEPEVLQVRARQAYDKRIFDGFGVKMAE